MCELVNKVICWSPSLSALLLETDSRWLCDSRQYRRKNDEASKGLYIIGAFIAGNGLPGLGRRVALVLVVILLVEFFL